MRGPCRCSCSCCSCCSCLPFLKVGSEFIAVAAVELLHGETMVLSSVVSDLDCAHKRGDAAGRLPIEFVGQAVEESGPEGVAAARGILRHCDRHDGDVDLPVASEYGGAV